MRKAAGILMIIVGCTVPGLSQSLFEIFGETTNSISVPLGLLLLGLTIGGGISAFRRKHWGLALAGAICSVFIGFAMLIFPVFGLMFPPMGILAVIFLAKRKYEFE